MDSERLARLTEQQRVCLRFVFAHMTSKEIAPHLGIEPGSVDQHIKAAMRALGVGDRRAAAKMLAEYEGSTLPLVGDQPAVIPTVAMHEDPVAFEPTAPRSRKWRVPLPNWGAEPSDLSPSQRLAWIFAIMMAFAFAFGVFLVGIDSLSRIGRAIARALS